jgi:hypothetical protein
MPFSCGFVGEAPAGKTAVCAYIARMSQYKHLPLIGRPLGRWGFLARAWLAYAGFVFGMPVLLLAGVLGLTAWLGLALLVGLCAFWFVAHARRLADAGRGPGVAAVLAVILFVTTAVAYVLLASGQAPPAPQAGFTTGGRLEDPLPTIGGIEWVVEPLRAVLRAAGPLVSAVLGGLLALTAYWALVPLGLYSLMTFLRPSAGTPAPLPGGYRPGIRRT